MINFKLFGFDSEEGALPVPAPKEAADGPSSPEGIQPASRM